MNIYPGDFTIRTCSTFLDNSILWKNSTKKVQEYSNQCYISNILDPNSLSPKSSYICICDDRQGCNSTLSVLKAKIFFNYIYISIILVLLLIIF
jgi:hypothetical protein